MRPWAWSAMVTGAAAALFVLVGEHTTDLRVAGAVGGALLAATGVFLGGRPAGLRAPAGTSATAPPMQRFFRERRTSLRQAVGSRVHVSVDGHAYEATLLNVSSTGALLRLAPHVARRLRTEVGTPVRIEDRPAGTVARVGAQGLYVDFAVAFTPAASSAGVDAAARS